MAPSSCYYSGQLLFRPGMNSPPSVHLELVLERELKIPLRV